MHDAGDYHRAMSRPRRRLWFVVGTCVLFAGGAAILLTRSATDARAPENRGPLVKAMAFSATLPQAGAAALSELTPAGELRPPSGLPVRVTLTDAVVNSTSPARVAQTVGAWGAEHSAAEWFKGAIELTALVRDRRDPKSRALWEAWLRGVQRLPQEEIRHHLFANSDNLVAWLRSVSFSDGARPLQTLSALLTDNFERAALTSAPETEDYALHYLTMPERTAPTNTSTPAPAPSRLEGMDSHIMFMSENARKRIIEEARDSTPAQNP
jgi:hypothetical protein